MVAAAVIVVAMLSFSGCLHLDGLSDTADGLLSSRNRQRMLEIMKDSHVGAMGVIAVACVLLLKFASLASLEPARLWPAALLMPLAGRAAICVHLALLRPARPEGLGAVFCKRRRIGAALLAIALLAATGWAAMGVRGLARGRRVAGCGAAPGRLRPRQTRRRHRRHPRRRVRNRRSRSRLDLDPAFVEVTRGDRTRRKPERTGCPVGPRRRRKSSTSAPASIRSARRTASAPP